jgi:hypothetical protein
MFAQVNVSKLYNEFAGSKNAEKVRLGGLLLSLAKTFDGKNNELANISGIKVLSLEDCSPEVKRRFGEQVAKLKDNRYETFLNSSEDGEKTKILLRFDKNLIRELVIVTTGDDPSLISISGKISPKDIEKWTAKKNNGE